MQTQAKAEKAETQVVPETKEKAATAAGAAAEAASTESSRSTPAQASPPPPPPYEALLRSGFLNDCWKGNMKQKVLAALKRT